MLFTFSTILRIHDQVQLKPSVEAGGLLFGGDAVYFNLPARNAALEPLSSFVIDPEEFDHLLVRAEERVPEIQLLGTYHSHPNGSAKMSSADAAVARETGLLLLVAPGREWEWRLWDPAAGGEEELQIMPPWAVVPPPFM